MKILFTFFITVKITVSLHSQNYKQVKIYLNNPFDTEVLLQIGLEFDHLHFTKDNPISVYLNDYEFSLLQASGFRYEVLIDDWYEYYSKLPKLTEEQKSSFINRSKAEMNVGGFGFGSMGGFYTLAEVISELDSMKNLFPNLITSKVSIGNTIENRPTYMVKISDNPQVDENEPEILYTARKVS